MGHVEPDGKIVESGGKEPLAFDKLAAGQQVKAWSTGMMLQSYPGQASVMKIEIVREGKGNGSGSR
ncbi:DUF3221 domain-containing protein [Paenibacillus flagellatus]